MSDSGAGKASAAARIQALWRGRQVRSSDAGDTVKQRLAQLDRAAFASPFVPSSDRAIAELLARVPIARETRFLELGCGDGRVAWAVYDKTGCEVVGTDIDPALVSSARRRGVGREAGQGLAAADVEAAPGGKEQEAEQGAKQDAGEGGPGAGVARVAGPVFVVEDLADDAALAARLRWADVVYAFLLPAANAHLARALAAHARPGTRVITSVFSMPGLAPAPAAPAPASPSPGPSAPSPAGGPGKRATGGAGEGAATGEGEEGDGQGQGRGRGQGQGSGGAHAVFVYMVPPVITPTAPAPAPAATATDGQRGAGEWRGGQAPEGEGAVGESADSECPR